MPRTCTVCFHAESEAIEHALLSGEPLRDIARRFRVGKDAAARHKADHLPATLAKAGEAEEVSRADDLLGQVRDLQGRALAILEQAEAAGELRTALEAIREARGNLELLAKLLGELDERPVNVLVTAEWLELRSVIVTALEPHAEARESVLRALEGAGNGIELKDDLMLALDRVAFAEKLGIRPDVWQRDLLRSPSSKSLLLCSRQAGKSTISAILALHRALYHPNSLVLVLAPALRQSQELFQKLGGFYSLLGEPMRKYGERRLSLELTNGSRIVTLPGSERTIRGFSGASLLIVDEAARVDDDLVFAIRPMVATSGGSLIMLSTPYGKRGVFFEEWTNGSAWERYEISASDCPRIPRAFLEEERKALPSRIYRQEYECSFEETDDQVFGYEVVDRAITSEVAPLFMGAGGGG